MAALVTLTISTPHRRILRQPCPATFASIHFTMRHHFDMDELFSQLVSSGAKKRRTVSNMSLRAFDPTHINQRSFLFVLKYYTLVDEDHTPAPWQLHDGNEIDPTKTDHLNISEGSSVVALSLGGAPVAAVSPQRRQSKALKMGTLYDTFAPFHVLNMQCFPDDVRSDPGFAEHSLYSGPQAFLECLAAEFKMAFTRLLRLTDKIEGMCIPSVSVWLMLAVPADSSLSPWWTRLCVFPGTRRRMGGGGVTAGNRFPREMERERP